MKKLVILIFTLFFISVISSLCEEGQIDINFATKEELDDLDGIGPVKAEGIINYGTFESVDELIKVYGIGEATLGKIKSQGLACVNEESGDIEENEEKDEVENEEKEKEQKIVYDEKIEKKDIKLSTIKLNTKSIKTENNKENLDKSVYAKYGFIAFCILLGFLFILKKQKNYKTEFE